MVKKIFLLTALLLAAYSLVIKVIGTYPKSPQNIWQENMVRMQKYVYQDGSAKNVILGSSLSVVGITGLNDDYYNLAAGGGNPFAGLEIIKRTNKHTKRIFIETNYLLTKTAADDKFTSTLFMPVLYDARKYCPMLLERNQPFTYAGAFLQHFVVSKFFPENGGTSSGKTFSKRVEAFKKAYSDSVLIKPVVDKSLERLNDYFAYFNSRGIEMVFFEMPVDCSLTNEPLPIYCRGKINDFCRVHHLKQLPLDDCSKYKTSDGNHLDSAGAVKYSQFFSAEIDKLDHLK